MKGQPKDPTITLAEAIRELEAINGRQFQLKQSMQTIFDMAKDEKTTMDDIRKAIKVFKVEEVLQALTPQL